MCQGAAAKPENWAELPQLKQLPRVGQDLCPTCYRETVARLAPEYLKKIEDQQKEARREMNFKIRQAKQIIYG